MSVFKCKMCGGTLEFNPGVTVAVCDSCGSKQTLPRLDDDRRANLYDRANHFRRNDEFDRALAIYEQILNEDGTDSEAYWSIVLCRYGIEYVEDPATHRRVPTVNRTQFTSIFDDENYRSALRYADGAQRDIYKEEAETINEIQKNILAISRQEEPFDVFICYKETDRNGRRTPDSVLANDLYHELTEEGFKVFFSRITLEDKLGTAYEPYIFAALNSAKVMVVIGTKPEYFNAVWVKNEWSRYLAMTKNGAKKILIPAYRDMDPYDLPEEFAHLQAQDMSKLGFMQDLIRGIRKIADESTAETSGNQRAAVNAGTANTAPLLKRAFMFLEDGEWEEADEYCEKVLDQDPECAKAYLGKLMAELNVGTQEKLKDCKEPFDQNKNYRKTVRFADDGLKAKLNGYIDEIKTRNENERLEEIYIEAVKAMNHAKEEGDFQAAAMRFLVVEEYKDAAILKAQCLEQAEVCRKDDIYRDAAIAMARNDVLHYENAITGFQKISGWKDADEQLRICRVKLEEAKIAQERERLERERREEIERIAAKKRAKRRKWMLALSTITAVAVIAFVIRLKVVILPEKSYQSALVAMEEEDYATACRVFAGLGNYKDSVVMVTESRYQSALKALEEGDYASAYEIFSGLGSYEDSVTMMKETRYRSALEHMEEQEYLTAYSAFVRLGDYKDSAAMVTENQYQLALAALEEEDYEKAYGLLRELGDYKDSTAKCDEIEAVTFQKVLQRVRVGSVISYGVYEQDNNLFDGKETIEWVVIARQQNKVLVTSKYALDCLPYHTCDENVTWETCTLRGWLNETFAKEAFNSNEQIRIVPTLLPNQVEYSFTYDTDGGNETTDNVFLLNLDEADQYFHEHEERKILPTSYLRAKLHNWENNGMFWWLRSPGARQNYAAVVKESGFLIAFGTEVTSQDIAVRPAMWIDLGEQQ